MPALRVVHFLHLPDGLTRDSHDLVYIGRRNNRYHLPESPWANVHRIGYDGDREMVIAKHRADLQRGIQGEPESVRSWLEPLRGKVLACWCAPLPCHGDNYVEAIAQLWPEEERP